MVLQIAIMAHGLFIARKFHGKFTINNHVIVRSLYWLLLSALLLSVLSSIFGASDLFTDPNILPKWIFSVLCLAMFGFGLSIILYSKRKWRYNNWVKIIVIILFICSVEALYGIIHFMFNTNSMPLSENGTFDNAAGFAACLCCAFPFAFYVEQSYRLRGVGRVLSCIFLLAILFSGSRAGWLAMAISCLWCKTPSLLNKLRKVCQSNKACEWSFCIVVLTVGCIILYLLKPDSADGRLLVWCCSFEMVMASPILGHGFNAVEREYMNYQADFLQRFPYEHWQILADNIKHLFNEYLEVCVQFGLIGLSLIAVFCSYVFMAYKRCTHTLSKYAFISLVSVAVLSFFSYPFSYPFTWIMVIFNIVVISSDAFSNTIIIIVQRFRLCLSLILCVASVLIGIITIKRCIAEIEWGNIAQNLQISTNIRLKKYENLEPRMYYNPYFLYNYGVETYLAGRYDLTMSIIERCSRFWTDYDLEILKGLCFREQKQYVVSDYYLKHAQKMCPNRFEPLYLSALNYMKQGKEAEARKLARIILQKKIKIPSKDIDNIKLEMKNLMQAAN